MQLFKSETHFNFMGRIKAAVIFSTVLILIGLGSVAVSYPVVLNLASTLPVER